MKAKIDLEKFICSLMKRFYKIHNIDPLTTKCWLDKVLEDQGLEYRDGEIVNECIYGKTISDDKKKLASSAKTCKNDTLYDLLQKMPSCITVDGIDYHFVMKKTSIYLAYYACYKGNGEDGRGNAIFGITAHSPIDLLTEMLEILKNEGLLELTL